MFVNRWALFQGEPSTLGKITEALNLTPRNLVIQCDGCEDSHVSPFRKVDPQWHHPRDGSGGGLLMDTQKVFQKLFDKATSTNKAFSRPKYTVSFKST